MKDVFKYNVFSAREWSAPVMVNTDEIRAKIESYCLVGKTIKRMKLIGLSYLHDRYWIEDQAYNVQYYLEEYERQRKSDYDNIAPDLCLGRFVQIDEPFLIEFDDGDVFEIDTPQEPEYRFSMNCIPWDINAGTNYPNLDADRFFAPCIGRTIKAIEIKTYVTDEHPMYGDYFDEEHSEFELVANIILRLDDGNGIRIGGFIDYCFIDYINANDKQCDIPFGDLKLALLNNE